MQENVAPTSKRDLVEILFSDDGITAYVKLTKPQEGEEPITKQDLLAALETAQVTFGIKEEMIEKLAARPIYGIKMEVVHALPPINGEDGEITYLVKRDTDYKPEFNEEGNIDYKNLDYFQMAHKGQVLCEIKKEKEGVPGRNIFGGELAAKSGRRAPNPAGKNTVLNEDETLLLADVDGVIHFVKDQIDISETMNLRSNVNNVTGNIHFPGDVVVEGDVCDGFSIKCGGDVIVKGVVEAAKIEAGGNVHIAKGINGGGNAELSVGGDFHSQYIEGSVITVKGNIFADYIAGSDVTCHGNIELKGKRELVIGGDVKLCGELIAKDIGNERELPTRIEVLRTAIDNSEEIKALEDEKKSCSDNLSSLRAAEAKYKTAIDAGADVQADAYDRLVKQIASLLERVEILEHKIKREKENEGFAFVGSVTCKRKLYQGVSIHFADQKYRFTFDNIEHCRIYWNEGEIVQATL